MTGFRYIPFIPLTQQAQGGKDGAAFLEKRVTNCKDNLVIIVKLSLAFRNLHQHATFCAAVARAVPKFM